MTIIDNRESNEKLINNTLPGEVFTYRGKCYMRTNYNNLIINLASGDVIDAIDWMKTYTLVTVVNATLTME